MYDPNQYDPYGYDQGQNQGSVNTAEYIELAKSKLPLLIGLLILLAIGYVAYDFFSGSYRDLRIDIVDYEGRPIPAQIEVIESGQTKTLFSNFGQTTYEVRVRKQGLFGSGDYDVLVKNPAYQDKTERVTIGDEEDPQVQVKLKKNIKISGKFVTDLPANMYGGQIQRYFLELLNTDKKSQGIEFVFEGDIRKDSVVIEFLPEDILSIPNEPTEVVMTIRVSPDNRFNAQKGETRKGKIRIKNTDIYIQTKDGKNEFSITFWPAPKVTLRPTLKTDLTAGTTDKTVDIQVKNDNKYALRNVRLIVEPKSTTDASTNVSEIRDAWLRFIDLSDNDYPANEITINEIAPNATLTKKLRVSVPLNAQLQQIDLTASAKLEGDISIPGIPFTMNVTKVATSKVEAKFSRSIVSIPAGTARTETIQLTIENKNPSTVRDTRFRILNFEDCDAQWLYPALGDTVFDSFDLEPAGSSGGRYKKTVEFQVTAPVTAAKGDDVFCKLQIEYLDPIDPANGYINFEIQPSLQIKVT